MTTSRSVGCASSTLAERGAEAATPKSRTETNIVLRIAAIIASLNPLDATSRVSQRRPPRIQAVTMLVWVVMLMHDDSTLDDLLKRLVENGNKI